MFRFAGRKAILGAVAASLVMAATSASAHCDGLDGPVVAAAMEALRTGEVGKALVWVKPGDAAEIEAAFRKTVAVRSLNPQARELADRYFFETLVRVHRAGEGATYTGLKPAGRDLGPAIPAADRALRTGSAVSLERLLTQEMRAGLRSRFATVLARRTYDPDDVEAGRAFVEAYVDYIHFVERLFEAAHGASAGHYEEPH